MNSLKIFIKKKYSIIFSSIAFTGFLLNLPHKELQAYPKVIPQCTGSIPSGADTCLVDPTSYELDIYRVYICTSDPFPASATKADLSSCMALFKSDSSPYTGELANNNFTLPNTGMEEIVKGSYTHAAVVFSNKFTGSGSYTSGGQTYRTKAYIPGSGGGNITTDPGEPVKSSETITNWRGDNGNDDNDYCKNGATVSRCEADFNNYKVTGIITDSSLNSVSGGSATRLFYLAELTSPFTLTESTSGSIEITVDNNYELFGNDAGTEVEAMAIAPFVFQPTFVSN